LKSRKSHFQFNISDFYRANKKGIGCWLAILSLPLILLLVIILANILPTDLSLEAAHYDTEKWVGREVRLKGWVRLFEGSSGPHFAIEDQQHNRVGLPNYDTELLKSLIGKFVTVEGKLEFNETYGIYLTTHTLKPAASDNPG